MTESLRSKKCVPCEGGVSPLTDNEIEILMPHVDRWEVTETSQQDGAVKTLQKRFQFKDFRAAMSFLREIEELAESEGHHPDFCVHYNKIDFTIWTHAISGLHENDFILASKIDALRGQNN
jgi:4a-hydroxytetrahydrobiopterin dehydratase